MRKPKRYIHKKMKTFKSLKYNNLFIRKKIVDKRTKRNDKENQSDEVYVFCQFSPGMV